MLDEQQLSQLKSSLENAQSVLVVVGEQSTADEAAAALGTHLVMRHAGKDSRIVSNKDLSEVLQSVPSLDQITSELGNENLTISFEYSEEKVDKVSYHIGEDTEKFYLTIKPKAGQPPLDTSTVEFNYTGASANLVIMCGVKDLEELEQLYYGYENLYNDASIVTFGKHSIDSAQQHVAQEGISSTLTWLETLQSLSFPFNAEAATAFLYGIESKTQGLTAKSMPPEIFEMVAWLLRAGAERVYTVKQKNILSSNGVIQRHQGSNRKRKQKKQSKNNGSNSGSSNSNSSQKSNKG